MAEALLNKRCSDLAALAPGMRKCSQRGTRRQMGPSGFAFNFIPNRVHDTDPSALAKCALSRNPAPRASRRPSQKRRVLHIPRRHGDLQRALSAIHSAGPVSADKARGRERLEILPGQRRLAQDLDASAWGGRRPGAGRGTAPTTLADDARKGRPMTSRSRRRLNEAAARCPRALRPQPGKP